jgi:hypothetical protein
MDFIDLQVSETTFSGSVGDAEGKTLFTFFYLFAVIPIEEGDGFRVLRSMFL